MTPADRAQVIRTLSEVQFATEEASCSSDDMAAYTHRLLKHLLIGISPEWQFASIVTQTHNTHQNQPVQAATTNAASSASSGAMWAASSAQELIQEHLWSQHQPYTTELNRFHGYGNEDPVMAAGGVNTSNPYEDLLFPADDDEIWYVILLFLRWCTHLFN